MRLDHQIQKCRRAQNASPEKATIRLAEVGSGIAAIQPLSGPMLVMCAAEMYKLPPPPSGVLEKLNDDAEIACVLEMV